MLLLPYRENIEIYPYSHKDCLFVTRRLTDYREAEKEIHRRVRLIRVLVRLEKRVSRSEYDAGKVQSIPHLLWAR